MPFYEYTCIECGNNVSIFRPMEEDDPGYDCPNEECSGTLNRVFHAVGISFKGGGFYKTDNR